jgi:hypothetical protein
MDYLISECPGDCAIAGQYSFPFEIQVPEWLPDSFILNLKKSKAYAQI